MYLRFLCPWEYIGLERYILSLDRFKKILVTREKIKKKSLSGLNELRQDLTAQLALWGRLYFGSCQAARIFFLPVLKCLRFKKKITETVNILFSKEWQDIDFSSGVKIRFLFAQFGKKNTQRMMLLKKTLLSEEHKDYQRIQVQIEEKLLKEELKRNHPVRLSEIAINGNDLINMGLSEGEKIGDILKIVFEKVLINPENNDKDYLIKLVQDIIKDEDTIKRKGENMLNKYLY